MKFFERDSKFNWVDENNVLLGYDSGQNCCEWADIFIKEIDPYNNTDCLVKDLDWENWIFDTRFFYMNDCNTLDQGNFAIYGSAC